MWKTNTRGKEGMQLDNIKLVKRILTGSCLTSDNLALFRLLCNLHPHFRTPVVSTTITVWLRTEGLLPVSCYLVLTQEWTGNEGGEGRGANLICYNYGHTTLWLLRHVNYNFTLVAFACRLTDKIKYLSCESSTVKKPSKDIVKLVFTVCISHFRGERWHTSTSVKSRKAQRG